MAECYSCEHDKEQKSNGHLPICEKKKVPNILIIDTMNILLKTRSAANFKTQRLKDGQWVSVTYQVKVKSKKLKIGYFQRAVFH